MAKPLFLGIDLGTSRLKLQVISSEGEAIAEASEPVSMAVPRPGWAEQDPEEWWSALVVACKALFSGGKVVPSQIESVGLSGHMHGATFLGAGGRVLRPCLIWADARAEEQVEQISRLVPRAEMIKTTGNAPNTGFTAPKIMWVMEQEPQLYSKTEHILLPKDYLRYRLTGGYATDVSDASATLLFDLAERNWSADLLSALGIDGGLLPPIFESTQVTGHITEEAGRATGLVPGTPVAAGGGDAECSALGSGLPGTPQGGGGRGTEIVLSSLGTSGQVLAVTDRPVIDPGGRVHSLCYVLPGRWHVMGAILAGGLALSWLRDVLAPAGSEPADFATLAAEAAEVEAGAEGVIFLPHLLGERTPHMDPTARAAFVGLRLHHSRRHLVRAVMEGVAFALLDGLNVMKEMGIELTEVRFAGGGGAMALWQQIQRDVFTLPAYTGGADYGAAYGAAVLAAISAGAFANPLEVIQGRVKGTLSQPDEGNVARYRQAYARYRAVYPALRGLREL